MIDNILKSTKKPRPSDIVLLEDAIISSKSSRLPRPILFAYINQEKDLDLAKVKRPFLRSIRLPLSHPFMKSPKSSETLAKLSKTTMVKKHLKILHTFATNISGNSGLRKILFACRTAQCFQFHLGSVGLVYFHDINSSFRYILNKLTYRISIRDDWHGYESYRQTTKLAKALKHHPIKEFDYSSADNSKNVQHPVGSKIYLESNHIVKFYNEMYWLEYLHLGAIYQFFQAKPSYHQCLNNKKCLKATKLLQSFPEEPPIWERNLKNTKEKSFETFYKNFTNVASLVELSIEVFEASMPTLERIFCESKGLKKLFITLLNYTEKSKYPRNNNLPAKFPLIWQGISNLTNLEYLKVLHPTLVDEDDPIIPLIPVAHFSAFTKMKKLTIVGKLPVKKMLVSQAELGLAISVMKELEFLKLAGYFANEELSQFFKSDSKDLTELRELHLELEYYDKIVIGEELKLWMKNKQKLQLLNFYLGVNAHPYMGDIAIIEPETLSNIAAAISELKDLRSLKLGFGCPQYFTEEDIVKPSYVHSASGDGRFIISGLIKKLTSLRRLIVEMGSGYLEDEEWRKIIAALPSHKKLRYLALGGNFSKISEKGILSFADYVRQQLTNCGVREFVFRPVEYNGSLKEVQRITEEYPRVIEFHIALSQLEL